MILVRVYVVPTHIPPQTPVLDVFNTLYLTNFRTLTVLLIDVFILVDRPIFVAKVLEYLFTMPTIIFLIWSLFLGQFERTFFFPFYNENTWLDLYIWLEKEVINLWFPTLFFVLLKYIPYADLIYIPPSLITWFSHLSCSSEQNWDLKVIMLYIVGARDHNHAPSVETISRGWTPEIFGCSPTVETWSTCQHWWRRIFGGCSCT